MNPHHRLARTAAALTAAFAFPIADAPAADPVVFQPVYAPAPADNPLRGFVPYAGQGKEFPHSLEFGYLPLASLMSGPSDFDWTPMERLLDDIASRGCQAIFRIYLEYPGKPTGVPAYLVRAGVKMRAWPDTGGPDLTPDYEDPRLRAAQTGFVAALGKRYDGDPRIGFITAGLLGSWGEWHCHPHTDWFASTIVQTEVMDAWETAFKKTPVLLRYPAGEDGGAYAPNARRKFGYHDDSFAWATLDTGRPGEEWYFLAALRSAGPEAMERWRTAPIGGEIRPELWPCLWKAAGCTEGQDFPRCVRETHATWLMDSSTSGPLAPDERERALAAARSLGYEFQIVQSTADWKDQSLEVSVTLTNRGVAPFYAAWPVQLLVLDSAGRETLTELPFPLGKLLPTETDTRSVTLDPARFAPGDLQLLIGVPNPLKGGRPLRFANAEAPTPRAGWLRLGSIAPAG